MPTYKAPVSDTVFLLSDVFDYAKYANSPGFSEAPIDVVEAILTEGAKFVEEVVQPRSVLTQINRGASVLAHCAVRRFTTVSTTFLPPRFASEPSILFG